ncbi:TIGR02444 family protein [Variovorax paradoxus]|uniref:TIGR02444 family protein n=1 Tax=Variovorax paradoxus TaxID=34073 RepID=UPI00078286AF|nr:TIGR02444 family protein [Variovorax paradoxus]
MTEITPDAFSREWDYALRIYAQPGVAEACLLLQDRAGVDVTVLLHAMYLFTANRIALDEQALASAEARVGAWRREVTAPLRALRATLKPGFACIPATAVEQTRQKIKAAEFDAEHAALAALSMDAGMDQGSPASSAGAADLLNRVLKLYASNAPRPQRQDAAVREAVLCMQNLLNKEDRARS